MYLRRSPSGERGLKLERIWFYEVFGLVAPHPGSVD